MRCGAGSEYISISPLERPSNLQRRIIETDGEERNGVGEGMGRKGGKVKVMGRWGRSVEKRVMEGGGNVVFVYGHGTVCTFARLGVWRRCVLY